MKTIGMWRGARRRPTRAALWAVLAATVPLVSAAVAFQTDDFEQAPIEYSKATPDDAISRLQAQIDRGEVKLEYDPVRGYLPSLLNSLKVPVSSQMLVWSKTSFQRDRISPRTPRGIYFNEEAYIGWVQGGPVLEVTAVDPKLGAVFYTLEQEPDQRPKFVRQTHECLSCHSSTLTGGVPGHTVRSVWADATGLPHLSAGTFLTNHESPMRERWGGWYVTGTHGEQRHMGNIITHSARQAEDPDLDAGANVTDLSRRVDLSAYPGRHSDIVALLVLEHQAYVQNRITKAAYGTRMALHYEEGIRKALEVPEGKRLDSTLSRIRSTAEPLVRALFLAKEAILTEPVKGTSGFAEEFSKGGPRDSKGRGLRDLDLKERLLKYPCSYLVYSEPFQQLPPETKEYVYRRMWEVLSGKDETPEFSHLAAEDRKAILEILLETEEGFAAWNAARQKAEAAGAS